MILEESPVHLPLLSRHRLKPHCCFLIQVHFPAAHICLDDAIAPVKSHFPQLLQYPQRRIRRLFSSAFFYILSLALTPIFQERSGDFLRQLLALTGKEAVILPQSKAAGGGIVVALAVEALFTLHHVFAAAGAFADPCPPGIGEGRGGRVYVQKGLDQIGDHGGDPVHEVLQGQLAPLHGGEQGVLRETLLRVFRKSLALHVW